MMGGVRTNAYGETNISGLFACGEVACTGVHGANRLASNSLMEVLVFSRRIVERAKGNLTTPEKSSVVRIDTSLKDHDTSGVTTPLRLATLQQLLWESAGIIRSKDRLEEVAATLAAWHKTLGEPTDRPYYELCNMVLAGRLLVEAALTREESRGAHFRTDFPEASPEWEKHIVFCNRKD